MNPQTAIACLLCIITPLLAAETNHGKLLHENAQSYTRVIRLTDRSLLASFHDTNGMVFYRSKDEGKSFQFLSRYNERADPKTKLGGQAMIEVEPGRVLLAFNIYPLKFDSGQHLKVAESRDDGKTWQVIGEPEPGFTVWNWEPEFIRSADGKLQLYYAWAEKPGMLAIFSQKIVRRESTDGGKTWSQRIVAVEKDNHGMPVITKMDGVYYMAVERYQEHGQVFVLTSQDGKTWAEGSPMLTESGWMFSTPALTSAGSTLFGMGMYYKKREGAKRGDEAHPRNGQVILRSTDRGRTWTEMPAPFTYTQTVSKSAIILDDKYKTNWSPALLPLSDKELLLMTTSEITKPRSERWAVGAIPMPGAGAQPRD
jgi:hypothetical protein